MTRLAFPICSLLLVLSLGCGNDVRVAEGLPAPSGDAGSGGTPPTEPPDYALEQVRAPDEYHVLVRFNRAPPDSVLVPANHHLETGPIGTLEVTNAVLQADGKTVELTTARQKLGLYYEFFMTTGTPEIDLLTAQFPSADTAKFWAADFASPGFEEYELVAERKEIGSHVVIYVEQGYSVGTSHARDFFDTSIYPVETSLFIEAPDMDENGKILLLGLDGGPYYGGYFSPVNAMTNEEALQQWGVHSNEMDMVYINIVQGYFDSEVVAAHEFQHLLYHERHGFSPADWAYHNEGLSECAVNAVNGYHPWALDYLVSNPSGLIASGLSITDWQYGNYDQYVLSYVFLSYVAGQLGGVPRYYDLFETSGDPLDIEQVLLQPQLGMTFSGAQLNALIASWAQQASGAYSFNTVLNWPGKPPTWFGTSLSLAPMAGSWLMPTSPSVDYPGTQGPNIVYAGIDGTGAVDTEAPFNVDGGALVVFNQKLELVQLTPEPTGFIPPVSQTHASQTNASAERDPAWRHPPPFHPARRKELERWRERTRTH
jgi:hypothetical protein